MKVFHASDIHYAPETLAEADRCFTFAVDQAIARKCEVAIISGDTFDHRVDLHTPAVSAVLRQMRRLADAMPVLILQGTFSHDTPGSLEVFKTLGGKHPVFVADQICQVALLRRAAGKFSWEKSDGWAFDVEMMALGGDSMPMLVSCLPTVNKAAVATVAGCEDAAMAVGEHISSLLKGWSVQHQAARAHGIPTVVVTHGTVSGCITEQGVPMAGLDHEFTTGSLFSADASAVMVGHIHQHQEWEKDSRRIAYPGSIGRLHFGELTDKGFLEWNIDASGASAELVVTPAKTLLQIEFDGMPDMDKLAEVAATAKDAHVRIRWNVDEDQRHSIDKDAMRALFESAAQVKLEGRVNPVQRTRTAGISKAQSTGERLAQWAEFTGSDLPPLAERLALLEHKEPETIFGSILGNQKKVEAA